MKCLIHIEPEQYKKYLPVILLIASGIAIRMINITAPLADLHWWRQTETEAVAYNFYHHGYNLFYPEVRWGGPPPNYVCNEFQVYPFLIALLWRLTGVYAIVGRLASIFFYACSALLLFKFGEKYLDEKTGWAAVGFYTFIPVNIYFSRTFQPESLTLFLCLGAIWYFLRWLEEDTWKAYIMSLVCTILTLLSKITYLHLGVLFVYLLVWDKGIGAFRNWRPWLYAFMSLFIPGWWFYHAHLIHLTTGLRWLDVWEMLFQKGLPYSVFDLLSDEKIRHLLWHQRYFLEVFARAGGVLFFLVGLASLLKLPKQRWLLVWLGATVIDQVYLSGRVQGHTYYTFPLVGVLPLFMGYGFTRLWWWCRHIPARSIRVTALIILIFVALTIPFNAPRIIKEWYILDWNPLSASRFIRERTPEYALVVASTGSGPGLLNLCNRYGWYIGKASDIQKPVLRNLIKSGADYFVTTQAFRLDEEVIQFLLRRNVMYRSHIHLIVDLRHKSRRWRRSRKKVKTAHTLDHTQS